MDVNITNPLLLAAMVKFVFAVTMTVITALAWRRDRACRKALEDHRLNRDKWTLDDCLGK